MFKIFHKNCKQNKTNKQTEIVYKNHKQKTLSVLTFLLRELVAIPVELDGLLRQQGHVLLLPLSQQQFVLVGAFGRVVQSHFLPVHS